MTYFRSDMNDSSTIVGVDLGGTKTVVALIDAETKEILSVESFETKAHEGFAVVLEDIIAAIQRHRRDDTVAIGLGVPGLVDRVSRKIVTMPNIPHAEGTDPRSIIAKRTGLPVSIDNDARCFAYAEALLGAGKGESVVIGVTLGTGVGGGIVLNGKLFEGAHGFAAELGHMLLMPGQPPYETADKRGEVEQFLSGTAMGRRCEAAKRPEEYLEGEVCGFMQPQVFREVAWLVTNLSHLVDPSVVVFGGSAGRALKPHLSAIEVELRQWMLPKMPLPRLAIGLLKNAAVLGSALRAMEQIVDDEGI